MEKSDALEMYVFLTTLDEGIRNNLYHSFEKGTKGKFQDVSDALYTKGYSVFTDCMNGMNEAGDDTGVLEISEDLSKDALDLMGDRITPEVRAIISENSEAA